MLTINEFLEFYQSKSTKHTYGAGLRNFEYEMNIKLTKLLKKDKRTIQNTIEKYIIKLYKNKSGKTKSVYFKALKYYLERNEITLDKFFLKNIKNKIKDRYPATMDIIPTNQILREILEHGNVKDRALFLTLASSGIRINEALQLTHNDINLKHNPPIINLKGEITKSGYPRFTFISNEAKSSLQSFLKVREEYIKNASKKTPKGHKRPINDNRIFPFSYSTAYSMFTRLLIKSGYIEKDQSTNSYKIHIHSLRKFFKTKLSAEIQKYHLDKLTGHENELSDAYVRPDLETLSKEYLNAEHLISIFEQPPNTEEIYDKIKLLESEIEKLKEENLSIKKDQYYRIHKPYFIYDDDYHLKEIIVYENKEEFIDIDNKTFNPYIITDPERIKLLKSQHEDLIKIMKKDIEKDPLKRPQSVTCG